MRSLLTIAILVATVAPATADGSLSKMMPGVRSDGSKPSGYMSVIIGHLSSDLNDDNLGRGASENSGWLYGLQARAEALSLITGYGGRFGAYFDLEAFLTTPGTVDAPLQPKGGIFFFGITPALALGLLNSKSWLVTADVGAPINTDFVGLSLGAAITFKYFHLSYRFRSGQTWHFDEVLDERVRIGIAGRETGGVTSKAFIGLEIIDGYAEDDRGRGDLRTMFRGSYTMVAFVIGAGK